MRILIVEDEPLIALMAGEALAEIGHEVVGPCASMGEALEAAESRTPDLLLTDINLVGPGSGTELARLLSERLGIPCLFMSAQPQAARSNADVAIGVLHKPYSSGSLQQSVRAACDVLGGRRPLVVPRELELFRAA